MTLLNNIANIVSMIGTCCGLFSRVPQVYRTYTTKSAGDLSTNTMIINITANSCFLFYTLVNEQYPLMINCISVITLEGSLVYMKQNFGKMKKTSRKEYLDRDEVNEMIESAIRRHNRRSTIISSVLGWILIGGYSFGLFQVVQNV